MEITERSWNYLERTFTFEDDELKDLLLKASDYDYWRSNRTDNIEHLQFKINEEGRLQLVLKVNRPF